MQDFAIDDQQDDRLTYIGNILFYVDFAEGVSINKFFGQRIEEFPSVA